jgi:hypothetical protein
MPVDATRTAKSGAASLMKNAQALCRIVNASAPIIRLRYPDRVDLLALLSAAEAVCTLLPPAQAEQVAADAATYDFDIADGDPIPGEIE